jgi:hypothetical protein
VAAVPLPPSKPAEPATPAKPAPAADTGSTLAPLPDPVLIADTENQQLSVRSTPIADGFSLRFDWSVPTRAAVFQLGATGWIIFDQPVTVRRQEVKSGDSPVLVQILNPSATMLRLPMPANSRLIVGRAGNSWLVDIRRHGPSDQAPDAAGAVAGDKTGLFAVNNPAPPVTLADPESSGVLIAVPLGEPGARFAANEDHKAYHVLPTYQGLLFRPQTDNVDFGIGDEGVRVSAEPDIRVSPSR